MAAFVIIIIIPKITELILQHKNRSIKEKQKEIFTELVAQEDTLFYNHFSNGDSITKLANQDFLIVRRQDSISKFKVFTYD